MLTDSSGLTYLPCLFSLPVTWSISLLPLSPVEVFLKVNKSVKLWNCLPCLRVDYHHVSLWHVYRKSSFTVLMRYIYLLSWTFIKSLHCGGVSVSHSIFFRKSNITIYGTSHVFHTSVLFFLSYITPTAYSHLTSMCCEWNLQRLKAALDFIATELLTRLFELFPCFLINIYIPV